ncbi:hypothetical protein MNB_SUP05-SYMBIONT-4-430 [hydrothermal vent metagenome]|uniref:Uncharacterized protein n=1 Tax=hydrothermal vent metagenome TaxID=652676 RepID=A0A1W1DY21_9ZZZZ
MGSYDIAYLSSKAFFKQIQRLHENKTNKIVIEITAEDTYQPKIIPQAKK